MKQFFKCAASGYKCCPFIFCSCIPKIVNKHYVSGASWRNTGTLYNLTLADLAWTNDDIHVIKYSSVTIQDGAKILQHSIPATLKRVPFLHQVEFIEFSSASNDVLVCFFSPQAE